MEVEFRRVEDAYADHLAEAAGTLLGTPTCFVRMSGGMKQLADQSIVTA